MDSKTARAKALQAVSRITFTLGLVGCIQPVDGVDPDPEDGGADASWADAASQPVADAGADAVADAVADAGAASCDPSADDWADCCDALEWQMDAGCLAWGPPVPPSVPGEMA